jgi:serine protease inhibitor
MCRRLRLLPVILLCLCLAHCSDKTACPGDDVPRELTMGEQQLVGSFNAFGLRLFREVVQTDPDNNVFTSPLSVSMALGMTLNGAAGETEEAMKTTLEFSGMEMEEIDECYESLMELLLGLDPGVDFRIANSIWYDADRDLEADFFEVCQTYFNAEVTGMDFTDPAASSTINAWVDEKTNGRIEKIVGDVIPSETVMFLINAIYFLGTWTHQFDPDLTVDWDFTRPDGSTTPCKMMQRPEAGDLSEFRHLDNGIVEAVDLPYANGLFSMTIIVPAQGSDIDSLIRELDEETWDTWMGDFQTHEGRLMLPRLEIECDLELKQVLAAMGMPIAFSASADFTRMRSSGGLMISSVKHKTFVKVDEAGTEAAAVTVVTMVDVANPDEFEMRVDRPFIFAIRENHSGTVLFMGKVIDPGYH